MRSPVAKEKTLVNVDLQCFVVTWWLVQSPSFSSTVQLPKTPSLANTLTLPVCSKIKTSYRIVSLLLIHSVSSGLCCLDMYWKNKTSSCSIFWHPITSSGGARHFCKHGWTMDVVLSLGSFMTCGMPLILWGSFSSRQDFQTLLCFVFEGNRVLKDKGEIQYYYFYPLPSPLFFLLPSFHAAVEHLRKICLPLRKFPVKWASGKRKCESWGHSWNQALAWLLLCFKGDLGKILDISHKQHKKKLMLVIMRWSYDLSNLTMFFWYFQSRFSSLLPRSERGRGGGCRLQREDDPLVPITAKTGRPPCTPHCWLENTKLFFPLKDSGATPPRSPGSSISVRYKSGF